MLDHRFPAASGMNDALHQPATAYRPYRPTWRQSSWTVATCTRVLKLARDRWIDLSGAWGFAYDDGDVGLDEGWWERADPFDRTYVPFPPESRASGIGDPGYHPVVWYRRTFHVAAEDRRGHLHAPLRRDRLSGRRLGQRPDGGPP